VSRDRPILARHHRPTQNIGYAVAMMLLFGPSVWWMASATPGRGLDPGLIGIPALVILAQLVTIAVWTRSLSPGFGGELRSGRLSPYARERLLAALTPRRRSIVMHPERTRPTNFSRPQITILLLGVAVLLLAGLNLFGSSVWDPPMQWTVLGTSGVLLCLTLAVMGAERERAHAAIDPRLIRLFRGRCRRCTYRFATRQTARCPECGQRAD
jgi:hypothetical protein